MGKKSKSVVEVPHGLAVDFRNRSPRIQQVKAAISSATLRRIGLASTREESDRLQGFGLNTYGECAYDEVVPDSQASQEVRSPSLLQRRNSGDIDISGGVEARLGGIFKTC